MKKGKPKPKATPRRTSWWAKLKPPPAPVYTKNTVIVCRHGRDIRGKCADCQNSRRLTCFTLLVGIVIFFTIYFATMVPANRRAICETMGGGYVPIICQ